MLHTVLPGNRSGNDTDNAAHLMCNRVRNISRQKGRHQYWRYHLHTCEILEPGKSSGHGYACILLSNNRTLGINRCCLGRSSCWTFSRSHSVDRSTGWHSRWTVTKLKSSQINLKKTNGKTLKHSIAHTL